MKRTPAAMLDLGAFLGFLAAMAGGGCQAPGRGATGGADARGGDLRIASIAAGERHTCAVGPALAARVILVLDAVKPRLEPFPGEAGLTYRPYNAELARAAAIQFLLDGIKAFRADLIGTH